MPTCAPLPPHRVLTDFLPAGDHRRLLDWTLAARDRLRPSRVVGGIVDKELRSSSILRDLGGMRVPLETAIANRLNEIFAGAGVRPFTPDVIEAELAAHGDGAHFAPHVDVAYGLNRGLVGGEGTGAHDRIVSCVYYFHAEPRRFAGGELRLHRFGSQASGEDGNYVDIAPLQNALLVFPSIALHEVRPVSVPSQRFEDSRFAVNIWLARHIA